MLIVLALKNPGRGFCADRVLSQKPGSGACVMLALKNPDRVDRVRSQKPPPLRVEVGVTVPLQKHRVFLDRCLDRICGSQ